MILDIPYPAHAHAMRKMSAGPPGLGQSGDIGDWLVAFSWLE